MALCLYYLVYPCIPPSIQSIYKDLKVKVKALVAQSRQALCEHKDCIAHQAPLSRGLCTQEFGLGIFPTQGSTPGLLHCRLVLNPSEPIYLSSDTSPALDWTSGEKNEYGTLSLFKGKILLMKTDDHKAIWQVPSLQLMLNAPWDLRSKGWPGNCSPGSETWNQMILVKA